MDAKVLLTTLETALILNLSERKVQELIRSGEIHATKIGAQYRIAPDDLQSFLNAHCINLKVPVCSPGGQRNAAR